KKVGTSSALEDFIKKFPSSPYSQEAKKLLQEAKDKEAFEIAQSENSLEGYQKYLSLFPKGKFAKEAQAKMDDLSFRKAEKENTPAAYEAYLKAFPEGIHKELALTKKKEALQNMVKARFEAISSKGGSLDAQIQNFREFIRTFSQPSWQGIGDSWVKLAKNRIEGLEILKLKSQKDPQKFEAFLNKYPHHPRKLEILHAFHKTIKSSLYKADPWTIYYYKVMVWNLLREPKLTSQEIRFIEFLGLAYLSSGFRLEAFLAFELAALKHLEFGEKENANLAKAMARDIFYNVLQIPEEEQNDWSIQKSFLKNFSSLDTASLRIKNKDFYHLFLTHLKAALNKSDTRDEAMFVASRLGMEDYKQEFLKLASEKLLPFRILEGLMVLYKKDNAIWDSLLESEKDTAVVNGLVGLAFSHDPRGLKKIEIISSTHNNTLVKTAIDFYRLDMGDELGKMGLYKGFLSNQEEVSAFSAFALRYSQRSIPFILIQKGLDKGGPLCKVHLLSYLEREGFPPKWASHIGLFLKTDNEMLRKQAFHTLKKHISQVGEHLTSLLSTPPLQEDYLRLMGKGGNKKYILNHLDEVLQRKESQKELVLALVESIIYLGDSTLLDQLQSKLHPSLFKLCKGILTKEDDLKTILTFFETNDLDQKLLVARLAQEFGNKKWLTPLLEWMDREASFEYNKNLDQEIRYGIVKIWLRSK
ncbi:MAG: hypothetical protein D6785_07310, partial [Planctomycetota bacterium]